MPAEDRVVIHVEVDADLAADRAKIEAFYQSLHKGSDKAEKSLGKLDRRMDRLAKNGTRMERMLQSLGKVLGGVFDGFGKFFSLLGKFSFVGMALEIGLVSIALLGVKAAMVSGRFAVRAYQVALQGLGITAGGVAVALGSIAAAMRQYQEVSLIPQLGPTGAAVASRSVMSDRLLSFYGLEGLQGAIGALAQGGISADAGYSNILRQLGDFTADPEELANLATIYSTIQRQGIVSTESLSGLGSVNQSLVAGIAELTGLDSEGLAKAAEAGNIQSEVFAQVIAGQAEATNAFEGQLMRLNSTVIGTLKGMVTRMLQLFADLGQPFIQTITDLLNRVETIITNAVTRIRGSVTGFGLDAFLPGMLSLFEKLTDFMVVLVNDSIPKLADGLNWLAKAWDNTKNFFIDIARTFAPLEEGASVLWDFLKRALGPFFSGFGGLVTQFNNLLVNNSAAFEDFGDSVGVFMDGFIAFFAQGNKYFTDALPIWGDFFEMVGTDIMPLLADFFGLLHDASMTVLPMVARILSQVAAVLRPLVGLLRDMMGIPGIGQLLGLGVTGMMFGLRSKQLGAMGGAAMRGASSVGSKATAGLFAMGGWGYNRGGAVGNTAGKMATAGVMGSNFLMRNRGAGKGALAGIGGGLLAGSLAGSNVEGSGGELLGALGGAASGAAAGAMFGGVPGAIVGGLVGGITGVLQAQSTQKRLREAGFKAGQAFVGQVSMGMEQALARGQGRSAFSEALGAINDQMEEVEKNSPEWMGLWWERKELQEEINDLTEKYNRNLGDLAKATGLADSEIEQLANTAGVDLSDNMLRLNEAFRQMGILTDQDFTLAGAQDNSLKLLLDTLTGPGSAFERIYTAPETISTYEALMREQKAVVDSQGAGGITGDNVRQGVDAAMAYAQTVYGNQGGAAMAETLTRLIPELDEYLGADIYGPLLGDVAKSINAMYDPEQNASLKALQTMYLDYSQFVGQDRQIGQSRFEEDLEVLKGLDVEDFDAALGGMLEQITELNEIERFQFFMGELDSAAAAVTLFGDAINSILGRKTKPGKKPGTPGAGSGSSTAQWLPQGSTTVNQNNDTRAVTNISLQTNIDNLEELLRIIAGLQGDATRRAVQRATQQAVDNGLTPSIVAVSDNGSINIGG